MDYAERPLIVFWEVTKACPLACVHCRATARRHAAPGELSHEEGLALVDAVAAFGEPYPRLVLTGGDPLSRPDLLDIVRAAKARGVPVALAPAPSAAVTRDVLADLKDAGAWGVAISLDGATPATHDAFRRAPGSFEHGLRALADARKLGLWTQVNTVAHAGNLHEIADVFVTAKRAGASTWELIPLVPTGRAAALPALDPWDVEELLHFAFEASAFGVRVHTAETPAFRRVVHARAQGAGAFPDCERLPVWRRTLEEALGPAGDPAPLTGRTRAGRGVVFVGATGVVSPSGFLPLPLGSVREKGLASLYRDAPLMRALRDPGKLKGPCATCAFADACGGSPSRAFAATGDPLTSDPSCVRVTEALSRVRSRGTVATTAAPGPVREEVFPP